MKPRIKELRLARGITQAHIARTLGVTQQTVSKWEKGVTYPDIDEAYKLAKVLFVSITTDLYEEE